MSVAAGTLTSQHAAHADHIQIDEQQRYWLNDDRQQTRGTRLEEALERGRRSPDQRPQRQSRNQLPGYTLGGDVARQLDNEDRQKLIELTAAVLKSGGDRSWLNPQTGVLMIARTDQNFGSGGSSTSTGSSSNSSSNQSSNTPSWDPTGNAGGSDDGRSSLPRLKVVPPLVRIDGWYRATKTLRVRGGPHRRYAASHIVDNGDKIHVVGQVTDSDWVLVSHEGRGIGFVFGRLLEPVDYEQVNFKAQNSNAQRDKASTVENQSNCRRVIQEAILSNGSRAMSNPVFCPTADGHWEMI